MAFLSSKAVGTHFPVNPLGSNSETNSMSIIQEAMTLWEGNRRMDLCSWHICSTRSTKATTLTWGPLKKKNDQLKKSYAINHKQKRWWAHISCICICRANAFFMYQFIGQKQNRGPMEEDPPHLLYQKTFTSALVNSLCSFHLGSLAGDGQCFKRDWMATGSAVPLALLCFSCHESTQ